VSARPQPVATAVRRPRRTAALAALATAAACGSLAALLVWPPASAHAAGLNLGTLCSLTGLVSGLLGRACSAAGHAGSLISAAGKLLSGHVGSAISAVTGGGAASVAARAAGLAAIAVAVTEGAHLLLGDVAHAIGATTAPDLRATWFAGPYWHVAAVAALLTLPFLCAAAIQAVVRGDPALLVRAAFGWLPLGMLGVGIAAPLTMLLVAGTDEMCGLVSSASGGAGGALLEGAAAGGATIGLHGDLFAGFFVALLAAAGALVLWIELLVRAASVYVIVLMLPLFFAAMAWPARRVWAARAVELLVALILSKFAIVAVLSLGGFALDHGSALGLRRLLAGTTLVLMAALCPWALMRLLPLNELAGAALGGMSRSARHDLEGVSRHAHALTERVQWGHPVLAEPLDAVDASVDPLPETALSGALHATAGAAPAGGSRAGAEPAGGSLTAATPAWAASAGAGPEGAPHADHAAPLPSIDGDTLAGDEPARERPPGGATQGALGVQAPGGAEPRRAAADGEDEGEDREAGSRTAPDHALAKTGLVIPDRLDLSGPGPFAAGPTGRGPIDPARWGAPRPPWAELSEWEAGLGSAAAPGTGSVQAGRASPAARDISEEAAASPAAPDIGWEEVAASPAAPAAVESDPAGADCRIDPDGPRAQQAPDHDGRP